ncbi:FKBP-type peptidyl-prolyl cis-trans isomerase [Dactylosporangium siamense]|uniref:FKBP-type peptidyl-prolyl cis-trans isomerase n=1 Tax=Dactylosporangium siamense TaxID=685454 RepID=UPI001EF19164|nr:FKBP-type peptidyl-prolyl cis-trans isomerase [Dactylosporangium siamense]
MTERVTSRQRPAAPTRPGQTPLSKAEKRAAAREARAREVAAAKRKQFLSVVGAAAAVIAVIALVVWLSLRSDGSDPAQPGLASSAGAPASGDPSTAAQKPFPPVPEGADPALSTKPVVTKGTGTVTKLTPTVLIEGKGAATQAGQTISVNYVGVTFVDGKEFDASWNSKQPLEFQLGGGRVIPGWDQGLVGIKVGSRVQLDIPSNLAYGDDPSSGKPIGTLRFVVDVLAAN